MAGIFINYRRDDAPGVAGRLFDHLALRYPRSELFMDVEAMQPGIDFAQQLDAQVSQCHVLVAVIGPHWLDARDQAGHRRLDSENDYVRVELASALKRDIAVIPVLVDGAVMPTEDRLPDDLKPLARRHALELRHTRFNSDVDAIVHALEKMVPRSRVPWRYVGAGAVLAVLVVLGVLWPKINAKLHPSAPIAVNAKPPPLNPMVATTPPVVAAPSQSGATVPAAAVPTLKSAAPGTAIPAATAGLPPGVTLGEMTPNVAYRGATLRVTEIAADPTVCQAACRAETRCVVWTYAQPKGPGQPARCDLKAVIPEQTPDACCTSAIERVPDPELREPPVVPAGMSGAARGIELLGGTYHYFGGADATVQACKAACQADRQCLAWDYVRPGIYSSDARCFLKNMDSLQVKSPCCIAGFERQVAAANPAPAAAAPASNAIPGGTVPGPVTRSHPMINTNLMGSDYGTAISVDDWAQCESLCRADNQCLAWTAVHPGVQGPNARCWLKNAIPQPSADSCCVSGIERQAAANPAPAAAGSAGPTPRFDTNLLGSDYRQFALDAGEWVQCRTACKAESACLAWTLVRPGVQGPRAHCRLKSKIPPATPNSCCISGIERAEVH